MDDLLELTGLADSAGEIPLSDVRLQPASECVASMLVLEHGRSFTWAGSPEGAVAVTGIWGWHDDWARAWRSSGDLVRATLDSTSQTLVVASAAEPDAEGETPRFQIGQLLRVESEYMRVVGITLDDQGADTLQVLRGVSGTTATGHALNTPVDVFQPAADVVQLVLRWAAWLYREPDHAEAGRFPADLMLAVLPLRRLSVLA